MTRKLCWNLANKKCKIRCLGYAKVYELIHSRCLFRGDIASLGVFFRKFKKDLGSLLSDINVDDDIDSFFAKLEQDLSPLSLLYIITKSGDNNVNGASEKVTAPISEKVTTDKLTQSSPRKPPKKDNGNAVEKSSLTKKTMSILKDMLQECGLKVSGR